MKGIKLVLLLVAFSLRLCAETSQDLKIDLNIMTPLTVWEQSPMNFGKLMIGSQGPFLAKTVLKAKGEKNRHFKVNVPRIVVLRNIEGYSSINLTIDRNAGEGILGEEINGNIGSRSMTFEGRIDVLANEPGIYQTTVPVKIIYD